MKIYIAADHAGFTLKQALIPYIKECGGQVEDCGAFSLDKDDDYPDFMKAAASKLSADVISGKADSRAVLIGASGQGEAIVPNRFKGVRCALYYGAPAKTQTDMSGKMLDMITSVREHNDANALSLGARFLTEDEAKAAVKHFLETPFSGEARHLRRIQKIDE